MHGKLAIALLGASVLAPLAPAQMHSGSMGVAGRPVAVAGVSPHSVHGAGIIFGARPGAQGFHRPSILLGNPYFYSDYSSEPVVVEAPAPQIVLLQTAAAEAPIEAKPEPLLIQWQGDRYVRIDGASKNTTPAPLDYAEAVAEKPTAAKPAGPSQPLPQELQPVVLVYRDGHREEMREYTIADGIIYARGDYWTDGYWTRKIQLTALNLPATEKASHQNGANFVLPASPNEVVTRF